MNEISEELKLELLNEISSDAQRINERAQQMRVWHNSPSSITQTPAIKHTDLEQLTYITEQIRLKLRLLGAPRIYQ